MKIICKVQQFIYVVASMDFFLKQRLCLSQLFCNKSTKTYMFGFAKERAYRLESIS